VSGASAVTVQLGTPTHAAEISIYQNEMLRNILHMEIHVLRTSLDELTHIAPSRETRPLELIVHSATLTPQNRVVPTQEWNRISGLQPPPGNLFT